MKRPPGARVAEAAAVVLLAYGAWAWSHYSPIDWWNRSSEAPAAGTGRDAYREALTALDWHGGLPPGAELTGSNRLVAADERAKHSRTYSYTFYWWPRDRTGPDHVMASVGGRPLRARWIVRQWSPPWLRAIAEALPKSIEPVPSPDEIHSTCRSEPDPAALRRVVGSIVHEDSGGESLGEMERTFTLSRNAVEARFRKPVYLWYTDGGRRFSVRAAAAFVDDSKSMERYVWLDVPAHADGPFHMHEQWFLFRSSDYEPVCE